jgi:hypothetical protein
MIGLRVSVLYWKAAAILENSFNGIMYRLDPKAGLLEGACICRGGGSMPCLRMRAWEGKTEVHAVHHY